MNNAESNMKECVAEHVPSAVFKNMSSDLLKGMTMAALTVDTKNVDIKLSGNDFTGSGFTGGKTPSGSRSV